MGLNDPKQASLTACYCGPIHTTHSMQTLLVMTVFLSLERFAADLQGESRGLNAQPVKLACCNFQCTKKTCGLIVKYCLSQAGFRAKVAHEYDLARNNLTQAERL